MAYSISLHFCVSSFYDILEEVHIVFAHTHRCLPFFPLQICVEILLRALNSVQANPHTLLLFQHAVDDALQVARSFLILFEMLKILLRKHNTDMNIIVVL
jgi:hypothetical protein